MNASGDAAEQIVRMTLEGVQVAAKITGDNVERLANLLIIAMKDNSNTSVGKASLTKMLKTNKPIKVFEIKDEHLRKFCEEAKRYGVMYHVLKDNKAKDGKCDIMVREEDAEKVNRIFERFQLGTPNQMTIRKAVKKSMEGRQDVPNRSTPGQMPTNEFIERLFSKQQQQKEKSYSTNPSQARTEKSRLSEPTSVSRGAQGYSRDESDAALRPSIKRKLKLYREEIEREKANEKSAPKKNTQSKAPTHQNNKNKKKKGNKEHVRG
ncbi:MAG: PcfB family protein [Ruminococcaceae bacterium]|nr:PcfB family protein [Oscillospiraceae bacterium]